MMNPFAKLRRRRRALELSQKQVAQWLGIHLATLCQYERGKRPRELRPLQKYLALAERYRQLLDEYEKTIGGIK